MSIDYNETRKVKISMYKYIKQLLSKLPEDVAGLAATPAANHLFQFDDTNAEQLSKSEAQFFHHNVSKLLFLSRCGCPYIQTSIAFHTTQVKEPDIPDYRKQPQIMKYLMATPKFPLILEADLVNVVK